MKGGGWRAIMVALSPIDPTTVCVGDEATNYCCCAGLRGVILSASVPRASEGADVYKIFRATSFSATMEIKSIAAAILKGPWPKTAAMPCSSLWEDSPSSKATVIYAIRRLG